MKVSLIMPTINVTEELELFLQSLKEQTYRNFELIVLDQNEDSRAFSIIKKFEEEFEIKYGRSEQKGLSLNRNKGLIMMTGDIAGFPDDDCEYKSDTLEKAVDYFKKNREKRIYSCRTLERGKDYGTGTMLDYSTELTWKNVENTVKSITFFVNFSYEDIILFDENLGVGAYFGSGEETDYVLTLLHKGFKGSYFADDIIFHPAKKGNYDDLDKAYRYALGYGALAKKEIMGRGNFMYIFKYLKKLFRSIAGSVITKNRKYHRVVCEGRVKGFIRYKNQK